MDSSPRLLILAQIPPPTHGQSVMVGHLVAAASTRNPRRYVHVNLLLSKDEQDVGSMRPAKLALLAWSGLKALGACIFWGTRDIYYVPAPGKRGPVIRDVLLLTLLKPFIRRLYLHWHSVGLGQYLEDQDADPWARLLRSLLRGHYMSLCLSGTASADAQKLKPEKLRIIPNGIPDPCPEPSSVMAARHSRLLARRAALAGEIAVPISVRLLYLGLCTRSKGIFAALRIAADLNTLLNESTSSGRVVLTIAGPFRDPSEEAEYKQSISDVLEEMAGTWKLPLIVELVGFTSGEQKAQLLKESDLFVFPTVYENEGLPLTLLEALSFGLPVLSTRWRGIPDIFNASYPFLVEPSVVSEAAPLAMAALDFSEFEDLRRRFLEHFELSIHLERIFGALEGQ